MRIATWNLEKPSKSGTKREAILQCIQNIKADIWVLTETDMNLNLGEGYQRVAHASIHAPDIEGIQKHKPGSVWTAIWTRLPAERIVTLADPDRTASALVIPEGDAPLLVYGTVLPWPGDPRSEHFRGATAFAHALDLQATEWTSLIEIIRRQHPTARLCVAGDFNQAWIKDKYISEEGRTRLINAMKAPYHPLVCATGEKDPIKAPINRHTIDHICISAPVDDFEVGYWPQTTAELKGMSDHYGLWLDLPQKNS